MAILNSPLGDFSGSLGEITFRKRNGKTVASQKQKKRKKSNSPKVKWNNYIFALKNFIASGINKIHLFKTIWKSSPVKGYTVINKICSLNTGRITEDFDYSNIFLIPDDAPFPVELLSATTEEIENHTVNFHFTIKCLKDSGITVIDRTTISAQGLFCCEEPRPGYKKSFFAPLYPDMKPLNFTDDLEFTLKINGRDLIQSRNFGKHSLLLNLVTYNKNVEPKESSQNIFISMNTES